MIHASAKGIPRLVSVIADNALLGGFASGARLVGVSIVSEVCRDFKLLAAPVVVGGNGSARHISHGFMEPVDTPQMVEVTAEPVAATNGKGRRLPPASRYLGVSRNVAGASAFGGIRRRAGLIYVPLD